MQEPELTLAAALRDASSPRADARHKAIRSLAPAYLVEAGLSSPSFAAADAREDGATVRATLLQALEDDDGALAGMAAVGLGMLGAVEVIEAVAPWVEREGDDGEGSFRRECAVVAVSFVGTAAPPEAEARTRALDHLRRWLGATRPDVRFQAAVALAEVAGDGAADDLAEALRTETHEEVRENLVDALSRIDPPPETVVAIARTLARDEPSTTVGFEAAMILASVRDKAAGPALVEALGRRVHRDRALEGLAVLGRAAPSTAVEVVDTLARGWLTPGVTRVRAAYALARIVAPGTADRPNPGIALLARLAWHPRPAVREAVADARANLRQLGDELLP